MCERERETEREKGKTHRTGSVTWEGGRAQQVAVGCAVVVYAVCGHVGVGCGLVAIVQRGPRVSVVGWSAC